MTWVFYALALLSVVSGWRVFRTDSMVRASLLLLVSFAGVGGIAWLLGGVYLGAAIVFMMAVEMLVMALFMVMFMMNPAGLNPMNMVHQPRVAAAAGVLTALASILLVWKAEFPRQPLSLHRDRVSELGRELLGSSMLTFESAGVAIVATMLCVVVLSSARGRHGDAYIGSRPPSIEPVLRPERGEGVSEPAGAGDAGGESR